jgi:class 3 adenylate cyclase
MATTTRDQTASLTVLFADMTGSTLLYALRGNEEAFSVTSGCLALLEEHVRASGGRVIKRIGDAVLATFATAAGAVSAAAAMHHALEDARRALHGENVHVRIGMSTGTAVLDDGDVYGDVVNVAARLVGLAGADEIFLAGETYEALPPAMHDSIRLIDQLALRGRPNAVVVYEYLWKTEGATVSAGEPTRSRGTILEVRYGTSSFALGPTRPLLKLGRDDENDIAVPEEVVSRHHADIVLRGDKFLVVDRSTNGTYVITDVGPSFRLTREELVLAASGRIYLGSKLLEPVRYQLAKP